jgi:hypothetical protein
MLYSQTHSCILTLLFITSHIELNSQQTTAWVVKVKVILRLTSVSLGIEHPPGPHDQIVFSYVKVTVLFNWGALSDTEIKATLLYRTVYRDVGY